MAAFVKLVNNQLILDDQRERYKITLVNERDFLLELSFKEYLDTDGKGWISPEDILNLIESCNKDYVFH